MAYSLAIEAKELIQRSEPGSILPEGLLLEEDDITGEELLGKTSHSRIDKLPGYIEPTGGRSSYLPSSPNLIRKNILDQCQVLLTAEEEVYHAKCIEEGEKARKTLTDVQKSRLLSDEEITRLKTAVGNGETSKKTLTTSNLRLVWDIASREKYQNRGLPIDDLFQSGIPGLMRAVDKYDWRRGYKFSTYATWWVKQSISRAIIDEGAMIRIPVHMTEELNQVRKAQAQLEQLLGQHPTIAQLAEVCGIQEGILRQTVAVAQQPLSLETPIDEDGESKLGDFVEGEFADPADTAINNVVKPQTNSIIHEILQNLEPRYQEILIYRFGFYGQPILSLDELTTKFGVTTRERVRQIELQALAEFKSRGREMGLHEYFTVKNSP